MIIYISPVLYDYLDEHSSDDEALFDQARAHFTATPNNSTNPSRVPTATGRSVRLTSRASRAVSTASNNPNKVGNDLGGTSNPFVDVAITSDDTEADDLPRDLLSTGDLMPNPASYPSGNDAAKQDIAAASHALYLSYFISIVVSWVVLGSVLVLAFKHSTVCEHSPCTVLPMIRLIALSLLFHYHLNRDVCVVIAQVHDNPESERMTHWDVRQTSMVVGGLHAVGWLMGTLLYRPTHSHSLWTSFLSSAHLHPPRLVYNISINIYI